MAVGHVENKDKNNENNTIFQVFNRLIKSNKNKEKSCAGFIDFLKWSDQNVGSTSATQYSAKRLIRGLAASELERQNIFFAALTTAISSNAIPVQDVISTLKSVLENIGSSKAEQNSILITTVLTYGAIVKGGKWAELSPEDQSNVVQNLISSSNVNSHVKFAASKLALELLKQLPKSTFKAMVVPAIKEILASSEDISNLENEFLAVIAVVYFKIKSKVVEEHFGGRLQLLQQLSSRCLHISNALKEELLHLICVELTSSGRQFLMIWKPLLEKNQKVSKKWDGYILLFAKILLDVSPAPELVVQILQPKLLDCLLRSLQVHDKKSKNEVCYIRAKQVLEKLTARVSNNANESMDILKVILAHPGGLSFDRKTRTGTVQSLINNLDAQNIRNLADEFVKMISDSLKSEKKISRTPKELEQLLSILTKLLSHSGISKEPNLVLKYVKFIFDLAFLKKTVINADLRSKAADVFYKGLDLHQIKIENAAEILNDLVVYADENLSELTVHLGDSESAQWKDMISANNKLGGKSSDKKYVAVRLLLQHMGLLMFKDQALASSSIAELLQCYQRIKDSKKKAKGKSEDEPHWVEVTVDLLLSMLSRENKLLRHVVSSVFPSIVPHLTATALQQIVDALDPGSRNDVLKHVDSDDSGDEDDQEDSADDEDDEEESAESGMEGEEETINDKLRMAVRNALGYSAALTDDESVDMDDMNEEEENRLNESLASAFRLFRPSKGSNKKQSKDDEALMHFRIRVLDLIDIVVTTNPSLASCIELLNPLFTLLEIAIKDSHQKPLHNRLEAVLKRLGAVKKFGNESGVTHEDLVASFKGIFERETSGLVYVEMAQAITECCGMLIRAAQLLPREDQSESLEEVCGQLLDRFFKKNDRKIPYTAFQSILRMLWDGNWGLSQKIMTLLLDSDLKLFKKLKLVELLEIFYRNDRLQSTATDDCKKTSRSFESKFVKKLAKTLTEYDDKKSSKLLPAFFGRLLPYIQLAIHTSTRFGNHGPTNWSPVVAKLVERMHLLTQQKLRNKLINLARLCDVPVPEVSQQENSKTKGKKRLNADEKKTPEEPSKKKKKRSDSLTNETTADEPNQKRKKSDISMNGEESSEVLKPKKKRKSGLDVHKMKQESRDLREAAYSQGLTSVSFSGVDLEALGEETPSTPSAKKKKLENSKPTKNKVKKNKTM